MHVIVSVWSKKSLIFILLFVIFAGKYLARVVDSKQQQPINILLELFHHI